MIKDNQILKRDASKGDFIGTVNYCQLIFFCWHLLDVFLGISLNLPALDFGVLCKSESSKTIGRDHDAWTSSALQSPQVTMKEEILLITGYYRPRPWHDRSHVIGSRIILHVVPKTLVASVLQTAGIIGSGHS